VFDQHALQFLVGTMGADQVMLGSDYPFPLGEERVGSLIRQSNLPQHTKANLLSGNATRFLELKAEAQEGDEKSARGAGSSPLPT
jgi:aminocarboxymuconate-semialdehyde decarboxylase